MWALLIDHRAPGTVFLDLRETRARHGIGTGLRIGSGLRTSVGGLMSSCLTVAGCFGLEAAQAHHRGTGGS
eukprot:Skav222701  [mRNA]  locus=scaffold402:449765:456121:- [translate_table: standard]